MEKTLIQTFIDIDNTINLNYRKKNYPGFIKNFIASKQRKKLHKSIDEFTSVPALEVNELRYYIRLVNDIYNGNYGHCKKTDSISDDRINALFIVPVDMGNVISADNNAKNTKDGWTASCIVIEEEDGSTSISYALYDEKNRVLTKFTDNNVDIISTLGRHDKLHMPWNVVEQVDCTRDLIAQTIIDDIKNYLCQSIQRSERIELND
jgi:hypothetical protein